MNTNFSEEYVSTIRENIDQMPGNSLIIKMSQFLTLRRNKIEEEHYQKEVGKVPYNLLSTSCGGTS